jgi:hypothetical protein
MTVHYILNPEYDDETIYLYSLMRGLYMNSLEFEKTKFPVLFGIMKMIILHQHRRHTSRNVRQPSHMLLSSLSAAMQSLS